MKRILSLLAKLALTIPFCATLPVFAQTNDACSGAIAMTAGTSYTLNTVSATSTGDPNPTCQTNFGKAVWYTFTPSTNGAVTISTCASTFDTVLQVYTGSCNSLVPAVCNDDLGPECSTGKASVRFAGTAGTTYRLLVGGYTSESGTLSIVATVTPPPVNDLCSGAIAMTAGTVYTTNTIGATSTGDPQPVCQTTSGKGVWYTFTPSVSGLVSVSTCGSDFDTVLQIYTGSCGSPAPVTCNNDAGPLCAGSESSVEFTGTAGTLYRILAAGAGGESGTLRITASVIAAPANDQCGGAVAMVSGTTYTLNTQGASATGDPVPICETDFGKGVWYTFTRATAGPIIISTCDSSFDTVLQVYTGTCSSLVPVQCNDDSGTICPTDQASIAFTATGGTVYRILVGGFEGQGGMLRIVATAAVPPPNDICTSAVAMSSGTIYTTNTFSATSVGDPSPLCQTNLGKGIWYSFTPATNGYVSVSTCASDFDTVLQVYTGSCGSLVPLICNDDVGESCPSAQASVGFAGTAGIVYRILVGGFAGESGNFSIVANMVAPPPNDACAQAIEMTPGVTYLATTFSASSTGDPLPGCQMNFGRGVWYTFTPISSGLGTISTCGSDFNTAVAVYTGECGSLIEIPSGCNDQNGPACSGDSASVTFPVTGSTTYRILAGGSDGAGGNLKILATVLSPNDQCNGAIAMTADTIYESDTLGATTAGDPTPVCQTNFGRGVWYTFSPQINGRVTISTCGSEFDTVVQIYGGGCGALSPLAGICNDDFGPGCSNDRASITFNGFANSTYYILVGGRSSAGGRLKIQATLCPPPTYAGATSSSSLEPGGVRVSYSAFASGQAPLSFTWTFSDAALNPLFTTNGNPVSHLYGPFDQIAARFTVQISNACDVVIRNGNAFPPCSAICLLNSVGITSTHVGINGSGTNVAAASDCGAFPEGSRWFHLSKLTNSSGLAFVSTDANVDGTLLGIFGGETNPSVLVPIACHLAVSNQPARVEFETQPGSNYWLAVAAPNPSALKLFYGYPLKIAQASIADDILTLESAPLPSLKYDLLISSNLSSWSVLLGTNFTGNVSITNNILRAVETNLLDRPQRYYQIRRTLF